MIRASFLTQGAQGPAALKWGASDFDVVLEDQVTQKAGVTLETNVEKVLAWVKAAGITPKKRKPYALERKKLAVT